MYSMKFYDTAKRQIVPFRPQGNTVRIYVCGITPYDAAHLGHIFTFLTYDLLQRRLMSQGLQVQLVRNVTDVDDPLFLKAQELGEDYRAVAEREINHLHDVLRAMRFNELFAEPRASQYIDAMAADIAELRQKGFAYDLNGDIYFDTEKFGRFGELSGFSPTLRRRLFANRGGDPERPGKHSPEDFLLWMHNPKIDPEITWETAVGSGRPGWHIECSVMSSRLLSVPLDIHGGGMDLIYPHHEAEIAQSEALGAHPFSRHWLHVAPLSLYGEKMSKSLGNLVYARDLLHVGPVAAIRLALLRYQYQTGGEWLPVYFEEAQALAADCQRLIAQASDSIPPSGLLERVYAALDNNLDMPKIYSLLCEHVAAGGNTAELIQTLSFIGIEPEDLS